MTITDEELYRLAKNIELIRLDFPDLGGMAWTERHNFNDVEALRQAVLQRFKPREPRVIERWVIVRKYGMALLFESKENIPFPLEDGDYLAKAAITEVMEDDRD